MRRCPQCNGDFAPRNAQQIYCDKGCKKAAEHARARLAPWLEDLKDDQLGAARAARSEEERWQAAGLLLAAAAAQRELPRRLTLVPRSAFPKAKEIPGEWLPRVSEQADS